MPVIDDGDRDLGDLRVVGVSEVAGDADAVPAGRVDCGECLMVVMVDVCQVPQFRRGQSFLYAQNRSCREAALSRAKPPASSGASVLRIGRMGTAEPSSSTTGLPSAIPVGRRPAASLAIAVMAAAVRTTRTYRPGT